jgi:AMMECR1 domain-containing protein
VAAQTLRAAFDDPQFPPLAPEELKDIDIEIFVFEPSRRANESQMVPIGRPGGPRRRGNRPASASPARSVEMGLDESPSLARLWEKMGFPQ